MSVSVLGIGNALVDVLARVDDDFLARQQLPKGSMNLVDHARAQALRAQLGETRLTAGGATANTISGLGQLGVPCAFAGKTGSDELGAAFAADLQAGGVQPLLRRGTQPTGHAIALITPDVERTFATYLGAAIEMGPDDLPADLFATRTLVHLEGYLVQNHALVRRAAERAKAAGCRLAIDLASYNVVEENRSFLTDIVTNFVDIVFANEEEAKAYTGHEGEEALASIARQVELAVVKLGKKGSLAQRGDDIAHVGIIPAKAIDTTGAGDLYASGFLYGFLNDATLEQCCRLGALTSGKIVEVIGAKMPPATWDLIRSEAKKILAS